MVRKYLMVDLINYMGYGPNNFELTFYMLFFDCIIIDCKLSLILLTVNFYL